MVTVLTLFHMYIHPSHQFEYLLNQWINYTYVELLKNIILIYATVQH